MKLEVIPLQHRNSDDLIPIIRPLIVEGGSVTGMNDQLIVKTTPDNLAEIKQILESIDKAARRLMITVKQDVDGDSRSNEHALSGRYSNGNINIGNRDPDRRRDGLNVSIKDDEGNRIRYRNLSTQSAIDDKNTFTVQTVEGKSAFVQTGQSVPIPNQNAYVTAGGNVIVQDNIEYRDVTSGFYVLPRLAGNRVTLFVAPQLSSLQANQGGTINIQNAETTASGQLGEWIEIGGIDQSFNDSSKGNLHSTRQQGQESRSVFVKVEEIK